MAHNQLLLADIQAALQHLPRAGREDEMNISLRPRRHAHLAARGLGLGSKTSINTNVAAVSRT